MKTSWEQKTESVQYLVVSPWAFKTADILFGTECTNLFYDLLSPHISQVDGKRIKSVPN